jgi:hypothetical protein
MKKRNPIVRDLHSDKYRSRVINGKKRILRDDTYDWVAELYEDDDGETTEDRGRDKDLQSSDDC